MALGSGHQTKTTAANFIPELWEDDVIATYKSKTVMGNLVKKMNHKGRKGDTFHIPNPARGEASAKTANTAVTLVTDTAGTIPVLIDKHYEYSVMYEDLAEMQALASMRPFYTDDAGFALAKRVDRELHKRMAQLQGGSIAGATNLFETGVIGGDGSTAFSGASSGNGTALSDAGLRTAIQLLEDQDVNSADLALIIPPVEAKVLRGISRFTEQAFVGNGDVIKTGRLGNLYGVELYTSTNCAWIHTNSATGTQSVTFSSAAPTGSYVDEFGHTVSWASGTDSAYRACPLIHKDAITLVEQQGVRVQTQYQQEYLGNLVTSDCVFGTAAIRDYAGVSLIVPA